MDAISDVSRGSEIFSAVPVSHPLPQPLDLDDLFGFSEAARKKLVEETVETKYFVANKIFINQVDSFTGKHIVSILSAKGSSSKLPSQQDFKNEANKSDPRENAVNVGKQNTKSSSEKPQRGDNILDLPSKETIADFEDTSLEEKCTYDTSKLTVAEYYDLMDLESFERNEFIKDKLGRFYVDSLEGDNLKNKLETLRQDKTPTLDDHESEFEIIGTLKDLNLADIDGVTEIIRTTYDDPEFLNQLVTCGIIIYCVNENLDQTMEATLVLNYIISFMDDMKTNQDLTIVCPPVFVLVSTFMTWSLTRPLSLNEELPFIEKDYRKRKPHPNYEVLYELEEQLIKAKFEHRIKSVIIVSGIPYGHEENELRYLFEKAYSYEHLPIYSLGNNLVPIVHVENLGQVIKQTINKIDYVKIPFIFAKDPVQNTMADISKAISLSLGSGYCEFQCKEVAFINDKISQDLFNKVTSKVFLESCYPLFKEEDITWKYELGFTENINHIVKEFIDAEKIKPLQIIFYGVSHSDRLKNIVQKISKYCNIPYVYPKNIICEYFDEILKKKSKIEEQKLHQIPEMHNLNTSTSFDSPLELILCEDEKCIENELEILKKLNIQTSDEANLLQESDKTSIVSRKLKMRPYVYHGYVLEEYPQSLVEANILFSESSKENSDINSSNKTSIFPDFVICYNELKYSKSQSLGLPSSQLQKNEELDFGASTESKLLEEGPLLNNEDHAPDSPDAVNWERAEEELITAGDSPSTNEASNAIKHNDMLRFFSNLDKQCLAVTLDIKESDNEDQIFNKTMNIIQKMYYPHDQGIVESSSVNEQFQSIQTISDEENKINKMSQDASLQDDIDNKNTEGLKEAEEITLAVRSYPLISYLINFISPTLTNGILEVTAQMPQDPIDFLAVYIFKNNPDGRMMPQNELKLEELMRNQKKLVPQIDSKACLA